MIWVEKCGSRVGIEDELLQMFLDNGWEEVKTEEPKKEEPKEKKSSPKKAKK